MTVRAFVFSRSSQGDSADGRNLGRGREKTFPEKALRLIAEKLRSGSISRPNDYPARQACWNPETSVLTSVSRQDPLPAHAFRRFKSLTKNRAGCSAESKSRGSGAGSPAISAASTSAAKGAATKPRDPKPVSA